MDEHMLFDLRHDYIPLNLRKYKNVAENHFLAPKNHLPGGFSAFSCCNHIEFGQLPISSKIWRQKSLFEAQKSTTFGFDLNIFE